MGTFKEGDKIKCINDSRMFNIANGEIYTVREVVGSSSVILNENGYIYLVCRFILAFEYLTLRSGYLNSK